MSQKRYGQPEGLFSDEIYQNNSPSKANRIAYAYVHTYVLQFKSFRSQQTIHNKQHRPHPPSLSFPPSFPPSLPPSSLPKVLVSLQKLTQPTFLYK